MLVRRLFLTSFVLATAGICTPSALANDPAAISVAGGSNQAVEPGASFPHPLSAIVTDSAGNPVSGVQVSFQVASTTQAGALLSSPTATTNAGGIASITATANTHPGDYPVEVSVVGGNFTNNEAFISLGNIPPGYAVGDQLPSISAPDENGTTRTVSSYLDGGHSYVLLELSAVWCGPSNQLAHTGELSTAIAYAKAHGVSVNLVTMLLDGSNPGTPSTQQNAKNWSTHYGLSPVLQANGDPNGPLFTSGQYLLGASPAYPTTILISPQGKLLDLEQGIQPLGAVESSIMHFAAGQVNFYPPFSTAGVGQEPEGVAVGDITLGNEPDLAVANIVDSTVSVLSRNSANDGYNAAHTFAVGPGPVAVAVGDPRVALSPSVVTANYGLPDNTHQQPGWNDTISVLMANGTNTVLDPAQTLTVGQGPAAVAIGDVNGDGVPDIVVANNGLADLQSGLGNGDTISVLLQKPYYNGGFSPAQTYTVGSGPAGVAIGDLNGDGWPDVVVGNFNDGTVSVLYGDGAGGLGPAQTLPAGAELSGVAVADMNGDGKLDIVAADYTGKDVAVLLRNASNNGFNAAQDYSTGGNPNGVAVADLNGDGRPDIVTPNTFDPVASQFGDTVAVLDRNASNTGFDPATTYTVGGGPAGVAVGDLNSDGKMDIVTASSYTNNSPGTSVDMLYGAYDGAAPVTKDNVPHTWVKAPPSVTLTATDTAGSPTGTVTGVAAIHYLIGANPKDPSKSANHPLTYNPAHKPVLQNGQRIAYSAVDKIGNVEAEVLSPLAHVVTDAQVKTVLGGEIVPSGALAKISAILSHGGYTVSQFKLPAAGTATLKWSHAQGGNLITVASGKLTLTTNGAGKLTVKLTTVGRSLLKSASSIQIVGTATMNMQGRAADSVTKAFELKT